MESTQEHITVLLDEAVNLLLTDRNGFYVDGTFGRGGHSELVLRGMSGSGRLLAIDKDEQAVAAGILQFGDDARFDIARASFSELEQLLRTRGEFGSVSGILLDLGVSSPQLDQPERGFSFTQDGPLDMRMDQSGGQTAAEWINSASGSDIAQVLKDYGEERFAKRMARAIVDARSDVPITTTSRLAKIVADANPAWEKAKHPATRAFQAIRIYINRELEDLDRVLEQALEALAIGGRLVVISFHSLEDRRVKRFIQYHQKGDALPAALPVTDDQLNPRLRRIGKLVKPGAEEVQSNSRARSAVMRVAEKIA